MRAAFNQEYSFAHRLRNILFVILAFFVLGIMGLYLSSRGFLQGVQELNEATRMLNLTSSALGALQNSRQSIDKMEEGMKNFQLASLGKSTSVTLQLIRGAVAISGDYTEARSKLTRALFAMEQCQLSLKELPLNALSPGEEILVVREFIQDAEDSLREAQIQIRKESDRRFTEIYENRFSPLIVAAVLAGAFFSFVVIFGLSSSRQLRASLQNLTEATDYVARGNLYHRAAILQQDEFGKLTYEFNRMVDSLQDKQGRLADALDKVSRLQSITNSFSVTLLPEEVIKVISTEVFGALRASGGAISLLNREGSLVENQFFGYHSPYHLIDTNFPSPLNRCLKTGEPFFAADIDDLRQSYPEVYEIFLKSHVVSTAYVPLSVGSEIFGTMNFGFSSAHDFDTAEKEFLMALTQQCAQALHRAQLYKDATEAITVRDEFLSIASHELRTPLTPLKLQLQSMARQFRTGKLQLENKDQVLKLVDSSDRQVNRLISLIDDLLDVSRISAGKLSLTLENINMKEMVQEVLGQFTSQLAESNMLLKTELEEAIFCQADRLRLEQVLINLLSNAFKYAPHTPVLVRLFRRENFARLEVKDGGKGISPENQRRIFDRFERVRDKNNIGGLGLGLYICRQIVEAHHGHIAVSSEPGEGATFIVEIPLLS